MTKDVIELAREAGAAKFYPEHQRASKDTYLVSAGFIERLAALVAAQVKERCAQLCESEWSNIAEKMYGAQLASAIRALNTEGDVNDKQPASD